MSLPVPALETTTGLGAPRAEFCFNFGGIEPRVKPEPEERAADNLRRREILASAESISRDSIQQFDDSQFHVASASRPGDFFAINLTRQTCNCKDFHRTQFCEHLAAVQAHFPHLFSGGNTEVSVPTHETNPEHSRPADNLDSLIQDISRLVQILASLPIAQLESNPVVVAALRSAKHSLEAAVAAMQGMPDKERIPPNQKTWQETAGRMGVRRVRARKQAPEERGITERCIGVVKGKKRKNYDDPYAGGERSGKRAKSDALSAAADDCARASQAGTSAAAFPAFPRSPAESSRLAPPANS